MKMCRATENILYPLFCLCLYRYFQQFPYLYDTFSRIPWNTDYKIIKIRSSQLKNSDPCKILIKLIPKKSFNFSRSSPWMRTTCTKTRFKMKELHRSAAMLLSPQRIPKKCTMNRKLSTQLLCSIMNLMHEH